MGDTEQTTRPRVFLSYSHRDEAEKEQLVTHLRGLQHDGIELWVDDHLSGGEAWEAAILERIRQVRVAVLLVTPHFLASDFIRCTELPALEEASRRGGLTLFPIIARHCAWREVPWLQAMQVRPKHGEPVWGRGRTGVDRTLADLSREIAAAARREPGPASPEERGGAPGDGPLRVRYDPEVYRRELLELLERLGDWIGGDASVRLFGPDALRRWRRELGRVRERMDADFSLVVVGPFKRGKSTLVNAILGQAVATADVAPETVTLNEIRHGPELLLEACLEDGGRVRLQPDQLKREALEPILRQLPGEVSHLEVRAPVDWLRGLCLVDTPGTGDLFARFDTRVQEYLTRADAVLFVLSPLDPLPASERNFLRLAVLSQDFAKITFVVNMLDKMRDAGEAERMVGFLRQKVGNLFPDAFLFGVSALDEKARLAGEQRPLPERSLSLAARFDALRAHLRESILHKRDLIQLERAVVDGERLLERIDAHTARLGRALEADRGRLDRAIHTCEAEDSDLHDRVEAHCRDLVARVEVLSEQAEGWLDGALDRLEDANRDLADCRAEDLRRHFPFFLADVLTTALRRCLEAHRPVVLEALGRAERQLADALGDLVDLSRAEAALRRSAAAATWGSSLWDELETAEIVSDFTQVRSFRVAADLVRQWGGGDGEDPRASRFRDRFLASLPQLRESVQEARRELYGGLADHLVEVLREHHRQNLESSLQALHQARRMEGGEGEPGPALERSRQVVEELRRDLADLRERPWMRSLEAPATATAGGRS